MSSHVEPILTMAAAARAVGLPVLALRRLVYAGRIAHVKVAGVRRVRLSAVLACLEESPAAI